MARTWGYNFHISKQGMGRLGTDITAWGPDLEMGGWKVYLLEAWENRGIGVT